MIAEIDTPKWQTEEEHDRLKTAQARVTRMNRMAEERQQIMDGMNEERMAREERAERRIKDATASPKMGNKAVAEACLAWLIDKGGGSGRWPIWQKQCSISWPWTSEVTVTPQKWWRYWKSG